MNTFSITCMHEIAITKVYFQITFFIKCQYSNIVVSCMWPWSLMTLRTTSRSSTILSSFFNNNFKNNNSYYLDFKVLLYVIHIASH